MCCIVVFRAYIRIRTTHMHNIISAYYCHHHCNLNKQEKKKANKNIFNSIILDGGGRMANGTCGAPIKYNIQKATKQRLAREKKTANGRPSFFLLKCLLKINRVI